MKATIEFDLNDPDDINSYELHNKALDMGLVLWELTYNMKSKLEDSDDPINDLYNWLNDELFDKSINIGKLIK